MPRLTKEFKEVFELFRDSQPASSLASTQFTAKEIEEIQTIFSDPAKDYEQACSEFAEKAKAKEKELQTSLRNDPFVQAIEKAFNNQQLMRDMSVKQLFHGLLVEFKRTSPSTKKTETLCEALTTVLNKTTITSDVYLDLVCLKKMLVLLYEHKIKEKLNDKSAAYKLIQSLLTAFMLYDKLTKAKYAELINILLTLQMSDGTKIPVDEIIVHDVFALRLLTLEPWGGSVLTAEKKKEMYECRGFFKEIAKKNQFKSELVDLQQRLLTSEQFFEKISYDKTEFTAYRAFIENLAKAMAFYREMPVMPVEESNAIVWDLLYVGIKRLCKIEQGFVPYDPIPEQINSFLTFLSGLYKKSILIPHKVFESAIETLLLHQVGLFRQAKNVDDEIWLHSQFNEIYKKYAELNEVEADRQAFINNLVSCTKKHFLPYSNPKEANAVLQALLEIMNENNYPYISRQIELLSLYIGLTDTLKIILEFDGKQKNVAHLCSKLIHNLRDAAYATCSPFLQQIAYLHRNVDTLWATPTWQEIEKMVEPLVKKGNVKEALVTLLTYGAVNYGLGSDNKGEDIPLVWRIFRDNTLSLFLLFSDPSNKEDENLISTMMEKQVTPHFYDPEALFEVAKCFSNLVDQYPKTIFNLREIKYCLSLLSASFASDEFHRLVRLAPFFDKNPLLFELLLKELCSQTDILSFLECLSCSSEVNKKIAAYVTQEKIVQLKQEMQEVGKVINNGKERIIVNHDNAQNIILEIYKGLHHQKLSVPEDLLECYFSACEMPEDYKDFVTFLFKKVPFKNNASDKSTSFSFVTKALKKISAAEDFAKAILDLRWLIPLNQWQTIYKEILLMNLPMAVEKFLGTVECFWLLYLIEDRIKYSPEIFENDASAQQQVEEIYSKVAENYLQELPVALEKLTPSEALMQKAQMIGGNFLPEIESYWFAVSCKKELILLQMKEFKNELLTVYQCSKLYEWYKDFKELEQKIKKLEQEAEQLSKTLSDEIEKSIHAFSFRLNRFKDGGVTSCYLTKHRELEQSKSYQWLKSFYENPDRELLLENSLRCYFNEVDYAFPKFKQCIQGFNIFINTKVIELMRLSKEDELDFSQDNIKQQIQSQLNHHTLSKQTMILEKLHGKKQPDGLYRGGKYDEYFDAIHSLGDELHLIFQKTQGVLREQNEKIRESFVTQLDEIDKKIAKISEHISKKEEDNHSLSFSPSLRTHEVGEAIQENIWIAAPPSLFCNHGENGIELIKLNKQKELLHKIYETFLLYIHEANYSPLVTILYDDKLSNDSKISLLQKIVSKNDIGNYNDGISSDETVVATPIYHAVAKGTLKMLRIILEGMKNFTQEQKDQLLNTMNPTPPLLLAYKLGKTEIVDYLIASGADVNIVDEGGNSLLHWVSIRGDLKMMERLLAIPKIEIEPHNKNNRTPLFLAMFDLAVPAECRYNVIRRLFHTGKTAHTKRLLYNDTSLNILASENYLHRAIVDQDFEFIVWLTKNTFYKHFFDGKNNQGETTLEIAARVGNKAIIKWLWFNVEGSGIHENRVNALIAALTRKPEIDQDRIWIIAFIISKLDSKELEKNNGHFRLLTACIHNNASLMQLINKGVNPNVVDQNKDTFLHFAAAAGDLKTIQLLIKEGKLSSLYPQNTQGLTPLMLVYRDQKLDQEEKNNIVCYLIEQTSDPKDLFDKRDSQGKNILDLAVKANDLQLVKKLIKIEARKKAMDAAHSATEFFSASVKVLTSFDPYYDTILTKSGKRKKSISTNPVYNIAFHLSKSVEMVCYFIESSLIDIQTEGKEFIKKLEENNDISLEEKKKIALFIAEKLLKKPLETSNATTPEKLARTLAPSLFRTRMRHVVPDNFDLLEPTAKIDTLKRAIENQDVEMVAALLDEDVFTKVMNASETPIEAIKSLRSQIHFNTKERKSFWIKVVSTTQDKQLKMANAEGDRLLIALIKQDDSESIEALNKVGYIDDVYGGYEKARAISYAAMQSARKNQASQITASELTRQAEKTYRAMLGAIKNYLLMIFKESLLHTSELFRIKKMMPILCFEEIEDCRMMIRCCDEANKIYKNHCSQEGVMIHFSFEHDMINILYKSIDKNKFTLAKAIFKHHPSLLAELFRVSIMWFRGDDEGEKQVTLLQVCEEAIKTLLASLRSQHVTVKYKIEDLITSALGCAEDHNKQLKALLADIYVVDAYTKKIETKRSKKLLIDENGLKGDALIEARAGNVLVHIGHMIEAFGLASLTKLDGAEDQLYLFDYARDESNRKLYIEVVKICLEKRGIKVPQATLAPTVLHIPGPLQPSSTASISFVSSQSSSSSEAPSCTSSNPCYNGGT